MLFHFTQTLAKLFEQQLNPAPLVIRYPDFDDKASGASASRIEIHVQPRQWDTTLEQLAPSPSVIEHTQYNQAMVRKRTYTLDRTPTDAPISIDIHRDETPEPEHLTEDDDFTVDRDQKKLVLKSSRGNDNEDLLLIKYHYIGIKQQQYFTQRCHVVLHSKNQQEYTTLSHQITGLLMTYQQELIADSTRLLPETEGNFIVDETIENIVLEQNQVNEKQLVWVLALQGEYCVQRDSEETEGLIRKILSPGKTPSDRPDAPVDINATLL